MRKTKRCIPSGKTMINEQFARRVNGDPQENRKLFYKEVRTA